MTHPGEQFYPEGIHWDDPLTQGSLPDLLSKSAAQFGARPAIEFRDRAISYSELEALAERVSRPEWWRDSASTPRPKLTLIQGGASDG